VTWCTTNSLTFNNCTLCPHCIYVFCIYLRTNSDLCHLQHTLIGFCNRDEKCLQRGTDWVFKYSGLRFVFRGYIYVKGVLSYTSHRNLYEPSRKLEIFLGNIITKLHGRRWFHSVCTKILTAHKILEIIRNNFVLLYLNKGCLYTENNEVLFS